jgi:hypothetical protein
MQYSVPITTKTLDVYIVEAKNGSDAAFKVAGLINDGVEPTRSRVLNTTIGSAKPVIADEPNDPAVVAAKENGSL